MGAGLLLPALALFGLFVLWPVLDTLWLALQRWDGYGTPTFIGLGNIHTLWADPSFRTSFAHSVIWEILAAGLTTALGLGIALLIRSARGPTLALSALFFPALLPPAVVAAIWMLVYSPTSGLLAGALQRVGLGNYVAGPLGDPHMALVALFVAWLWSALGVGTLIFWAALRAIGREWDDPALLEGAGSGWRFLHITLPAIRRSGLAAVLVNTALGAQVFDLVFLTTGGGPGSATMMLPIEVYGRAFNGRAGEGAAAAAIQILLGLALAGLALAILRGGESFQTGDVQPPPRSGTALPTVAVIALLAVVLSPLAWLARAVFEPGRAFALGGGGLQAQAALDNVQTVWDAGMGGALLTGALIAAGVVALTLLLAPPAAFSLAHLVRRPAIRLLALALLFMGLLEPESVLIVPLFSSLRDLNLLDTSWGVLLPEAARALPLAVLVLWAFFVGEPADVLEASRVDGAGPLQQMRYIALPLARPALLTVAVWGFVSSWNEYLLPTIVSQDGSLQTVSTLLGTFVGTFDTQFGALAAGCILATAPTLLAYLLLRRPAAAALASAERRFG